MSWTITRDHALLRATLDGWRPEEGRGFSQALACALDRTAGVVGVLVYAPEVAVEQVETFLFRSLGDRVNAAGLGLAVLAA